MHPTLVGPSWPSTSKSKKPPLVRDGPFKWPHRKVGVLNPTSRGHTKAWEYFARRTWSVPSALTYSLGVVDHPGSIIAVCWAFPSGACPCGMLWCMFGWCHMRMWGQRVHDWVPRALQVRGTPPAPVWQTHKAAAAPSYRWHRQVQPPGTTLRADAHAAAHARWPALCLGY